MRFVIRILTTLVVIKSCDFVVLPCDFNFSRQNGYSCRAVNFVNSDRFARITQVVGDHLYESDTSYRSRSNKSVVRVTIWNMTVDYLPGNLTFWFPHLKTLQVKKCGLKNLTRGEELNSLRKIYFGFNEIDLVPVNYFWHFCKLEILSLHGNKISELADFTFRDLFNLKRLSLGGNQLKELKPILFERCYSLEYINLDNNKLEFIDGQLFSNSAQLARIFLRNNLIKSIDDDFLSYLPRLLVALFQNNTCIDESFPETPLAKQDPLEYIQSRFRDSCSPPPEITTTTTMPTTKPPRKKPKYQNQSHKIYYFENCEWKTPKGHRYF